MSPERNPECPPTREQLLAMAYADGELAGSERVEFEALLAAREDLAREVAAHQRLLVLGRAAAGAEPLDHEWRRTADEPLQRASRGLGFALVGLGLLAGVAWLVWAILRAELAPALQVAVVCTLLGSLALLLAALRMRRRTLPYDPYRDLER
jgi:anti-sigma factor RsiW